MPLLDAFDTTFDAASLRLMASGMVGHVGGAVALTATGRGEGVTTVAIGLASALARHSSSRVLLVDGTPLGQRAGALLGQSDAQRSLRDVRASGDKLGELVRPVPGFNFDLLMLADVPRRGVGDADTWDSAWRTLRQAYASVVVDAGSLRSEGPHLWGAWVDHIAIVIDSTRVTRDAMEAQKRRLKNSDVRLSGFILNKRRFHVPPGLYGAIT